MKMVCVSLHKSLYLVFILSATLNLMLGDKFIGNFLRSKIKNYIESKSNSANHKLWMNYLEKRLAIICMYVSIQPFNKLQIFSMLEFQKRNLQRDIVSKMYVLYSPENVKFLVQSSIVGSFGATSKNGEVVAVADECMTPKSEYFQKKCKRSRGKGIFEIFQV